MSACAGRVIMALASGLGAVYSWYANLLLRWSARADATWDRRDLVLWRLHDRLIDAATLANGYGEIVQTRDVPMIGRQRWTYVREAVVVVGGELPANIARAMRFGVLRRKASRRRRSL